MSTTRAPKRILSSSSFLFAALLFALLLPGSAAAQSLEVMLVAEYEFVWNDSGSGADQDGSFWRPMPDIGWYRVGHHVKSGHSAPSEPTMVVRSDNPKVLAHPTGYVLVWNDSGSGSDGDVSVWHPLCPDGFQALGDVTQRGYQQPTRDEVVCVLTGELVQAKEGSVIWTDSGSGGDYDFSAWGVRFTNDYRSLGLFYGSNRYDRPAAEQFYAVK